ncbi:MAG: hypothetical protein HFG49_02525 [Lachnospiraceae bacterium]|jgi:CDP-glycerol glycerophosphotransferase|nr:hypothetical protein [Lachnospiraceae bacterium]
MDIKIKIMCLLNKIIPKKAVILFDSFPNICDNSYALYEYIIKNRKDICRKYQLIWTKKGYVDLDKLNILPNTKVFEKKSFAGIWCFLRAQYVISTHGFFRWVRSGKNQLQINLWHGCGYKDVPPKDRGYRGDMTIVISDRYKSLYSDFFSLNQDSVHITGYPRNDILFQKSTALKKLGINKERYKKIILWMPTYRKAVQGHAGIDGRTDSFMSSNLSKEECETLNKALSDRDFFLIAKLHPMESSTLDKMKGLSNIRSITSQNLLEQGVQLYELLADSDVLLSDYSSIVVDYLLLDKPVVMVLSDMDEYEKNRGFVFHPVADYFPGPIIGDLTSLIHYFQNADEIDLNWKYRRKEIKDKMHVYQDSGSAARVADLIWGKTDNEVL